MRRITLFLLVFLVAAMAAAAPLTVVNVGAPAINCKFDPSCKITVTDTTANFTLPGTSGNAFLQSRTWPAGRPGTVLKRTGTSLRFSSPTELWAEYR